MITRRLLGILVVVVALALALTGCSTASSEDSGTVATDEPVVSVSTDPAELIVGEWREVYPKYSESIDTYYADGTFAFGAGSSATTGRYSIASQFDQPVVDIRFSDGSGSPWGVEFDGPDKMTLTKSYGTEEYERVD